jgi:uncharacterized protein YbbC (DUF1343 family)
MKTGLEVFLEKKAPKYRGMRLGVLCNQASVDGNLRHISQLITEKKHRLEVTCFFGPQHGIRGEKQDNMVESQDFLDPATGLPVFSLYADTREPTDKMLSKIDAFVVDLQDIGTRIYTFVYTLANCMRAAKRASKKVIVLDRPNPINGISLEGNTLEPEYSSFVGQFPIIVRHGMTMGELALLINDAFSIGCELEVIRMVGWKRSQHGDEWKRDWITPSPNIPCFESALVFPGGVFFEGTNVSEGRGTTKPFEWIGAPYIQPDKLASHLNAKKLGGVFFRPIYFQPTYQKWKDEVCGGVQVHVLDRKKFNGFRTGIQMLESIASLFSHSFAWKKPPYEYEHTRMPIDLIAGTSLLRDLIENGKPMDALEEQAQTDVAQFKKLRKPFLLYQ